MKSAALMRAAATKGVIRSEGSGGKQGCGSGGQLQKSKIRAVLAFSMLFLSKRGAG